MTESIDALRDRLSAREADLADLRARLKDAKDAAASPAAPPSISNIQKRYLSAVANLETKRSAETAPAIIRAGTDGVSSLASRWNKGIDGVKVERANITVWGDINSAKKNFSKKDVPHVPSGASGAGNGAGGQTPSGKGAGANGEGEEEPPAELLVEDDDGVPSWAKNQRKLVIRKENARSSIRDVDVRELQGTVLEQGTQVRGKNEAEEEAVVPRGNVKAALAMWGKTAEEDARALAEKKKDEERKAAERAVAQKQREEEERRISIRKAIEKFGRLGLADLKDEPQDEEELMAFLERKIVLMDKEIRDVEEELDKLDPSK